MLFEVISEISTDIPIFLGYPVYNVITVLLIKMTYVITEMINYSNIYIWKIYIDKLYILDVVNVTYKQLLKIKNIKYQIYYYLFIYLLYILSFIRKIKQIFFKCDIK